MSDLHFDRSISGPLLSMLKDGAARHLVDLASSQPPTKPMYDLQLRRDPKGNNPKSWATLYYGMTALLNLYGRNGRFRLDAHKSYMSAAKFDSAWTTWQSTDSARRFSPELLVEIPHLGAGVAG